MLAVVKLHDLGADDRLQRVVVIGQVGEGVLAPGTGIQSRKWRYLRGLRDYLAFRTAVDDSL